MDKIIVYVDDAAYALAQLEPMMQEGAPAHWVIVACAPRLTQRVSKFLSHSAREQWRRKWAARLFAQLEPLLRQRGDQVETVIATGPLPEFTAQLRQTLGSARVLDARRPKFGVDMAPVVPSQVPAGSASRWSLPGAVAGMGAALVLAET
jgi:hypothetical protein